MHRLIHTVVHRALLVFPHRRPQSIVDNVEDTLTTVFAQNIALTCSDNLPVMSVTQRVAAALSSVNAGAHIPDCCLRVVVHNVLHTVHGRLWST